MERVYMILRVSVAALILGGLSPRASQGQEVAQESDMGAWTVEHNIRLEAVKRALPAYPEQALPRRVEGAVEVLIGVDSQGVVKKVKAPPWADELLARAAAEAARQWEFGRHELLPPGKYLVSRLSFRFFIEEGEGRAELLKPAPYSPADEKMRGRGASPDRAWEEWKEVP